MVLYTVYLPTKFSGSQAEGAVADETLKTDQLAERLSVQTGCAHNTIAIQSMFESGIGNIEGITGLSFEAMENDVKVKNIAYQENPKNEKSEYHLLFQNIQARLRMVTTYLYAQALGFYLVLGSSNADEILVGYYTKYDASAADLNPIGSVPKKYIAQILETYSTQLPALKLIKDATPSAELLAPTGGKVQTDEDDIKLTYDEIYEFGKLRSMGFGPIDTYTKLRENSNLVPGYYFKGNQKEALFQFMWRYRANRHKAVIVPPAVHLLPSPDDNRYDMRPFLYPDLQPYKDVITGLETMYN
jgi:NH3-dependent NAD+ synthetase